MLITSQICLKSYQNPKIIAKLQNNSNSTGIKMSGKTTLVWFRNDLRIHDNEILLEATLKSSQIIPVYIFDPRYYTTTKFNTKKTGERRIQFTLESVANLKSSLQNLGGDLLVLRGKAEDIIPQIVKEYQVDEVYHHREVASEETEISSVLEDALWKMQINLKHFIGHTMHHKEDLPFPIKDIPDVFAKFRKKVEREGEIRNVFESPVKINIPSNLQSSEIPSMTDLGFENLEKDSRASINFIGGEDEGVKRLHQYIWETEINKGTKLKKHSLMDQDYSSKLGPWLSFGCVSPRLVYWEIIRFEKEKGANSATHKLIIDLLWRDYFRFMFKKHGTIYFTQDTDLNIEEMSVEANQLFEKWKNGKTNVPFIDANMRELNHTGYISAKGRLCAATYLVKELQINWKLGAAYFEEKLLDYAPASNWGNWALVANIINTELITKDVNIEKVAKEIDPKGEYVKQWLPELEELSTN